MDSPAPDPPLLFISDVHFGGFSKSQNERIESELIQLINYCLRNNIRMAILGDLFDYWMEYPDFEPSFAQRLLDRFEEYNNQLGPTLFITGNHDNWTRDHLRQRGFYLIHETYQFNLDKEQVLMLHGDGLADSSLQLKRPLLHRFLRSDVFVSSFQALFPPALGLTLMKYFSRVTRKMDWNPHKENHLNNWAKKQLKKSTATVVLAGHDHIPREKQFSFGTYINLGTFYKHRTMALYNKEGISLVEWRPHLQTLTKFENSSH